MDRNIRKHMNKQKVVKVVISIIVAGVFLFALYVNTARTYSERNVISRSEYYVYMLKKQLIADTAKDADYPVAHRDVVESIFLHADPKWYQYLPEHLVFEVKLKHKDQSKFYLYVPKAEDRQDGKWFKEVDLEEIPDNLGFADGFRRAVIIAAIALLIIGLLIVRPVVKAFTYRDDQER